MNAERLSRILDISVKDGSLLEQALVHRSYLNENPDFPLESNERLEFLGDAVLDLVAADYLYSTYPQLSEGELTPLRAALVRGETLVRWAKEIGLGEWLYLSRGEEASGGRQRQTILAGVFEALLGAIYLDQGLEVARVFLLRYLISEAERVVASEAVKDYKTRLQELVQNRLRTTPTYRLVEASGPDHARVFTIEVLAGDDPLARGTGTSKQAAEMEAAKVALEILLRQSSETK